MPIRFGVIGNATLDSLVPMQSDGLCNEVYLMDDVF